MRDYANRDKVTPCRSKIKEIEQTDETSKIQNIQTVPIKLIKK